MIASRRGTLLALAGLSAAACALLVAGCERSGPETAAVHDFGDQPFRLLRFLSGSSDGVAVRETGIAGQSRSAIGGTVPYRFSCTFRAPADGRLWFGLAREDDGSSEVSVSVRAQGGAALFEERLGPGAGWRDFRVDLGARGPGEVQLDFAADGGAGARVSWSGLHVDAQDNARPNVVVFMLDTLRPDHLGCYGYPRPTSPNIDALAAAGVRFDRAFSVAPWTDPAILSLFTGLYPSDVWEPAGQAEIVKRVLPPGATLAGALASAGYYTVAASDHPGIRAARFGRGFDVFCHLFAAGGDYRDWRQTPTDAIAEQLRQLLRSGPPNGKLLYVHLIYPHRPYEPPAPYDEMFGPQVPVARPAPADAGRDAAELFDPEHAENLIRLYDGEIRRTDDLIGDFLADLEGLGLSDDTIVVVLSDHGEGFWEHGLVEHGNSLYNELLRIPLVIRAPGRLPAGHVAEDVVSIVDVLPTILDLTGVTVEGVQRGVSLVPVVASGTPADLGERLVLSEFPRMRMIDGRALQSAAEKLIHPGPGRDSEVEYFRLGQDVGETTNLYGSAESRDASRRLLGVLEELQAAGPATGPATGDGFEPPVEMIEALRALGYVE